MRQPWDSKVDEHRNGIHRRGLPREWDLRYFTNQLVKNLNRAAKTGSFVGLGMSWQIGKVSPDSKIRRFRERSGYRFRYQ